MRIAVIGAGAMGCLFAARLRVSGNDVLLVHDNPGTVSAIRKKGVRLRELAGRTRSVRVPIAFGPAVLRDFDMVLFAVKAYSTEKAARQYRGRIGPRSTILTLQNGLGNVEVLSRFFGASTIVAGSTSEGSLLGPGVITHTGKGRTVIGELDGSASRRCSDIIVVLKEAGFQASMTQNVKGVVWCKAIVNAAINPVSALTRLRNGELAGSEGLRWTMRAVLDEGVRVSKAERVRLEPRDPGRLLFGILRATGKNESSMLQDVLNGRRTEIRQLNWAIVERGDRVGVSTPCNAVLAALVLSLERSYLVGHP